MRHDHALFVPVARRLALLLLVAAGWLLARPVLAADEQSIVLDLAVEPSHQPTSMCVISTAGSRTGSFVYSLPLDDFEQAVRAVGSRAPYDTPALEQAIAGTHQDMLDALESLAPIAQTDACDGPHAECNPTLPDAGHVRTFFSGLRGGTTSKPLHVVCGRNSAHPDRRGKVLLVSLNFMEEDDVPITEIRLDGSVGAITLARRSPPTVVARVAGGHYVAGTTHVALGGRIQLPLQPRCSTRTVTLPKTDLQGAGLGRVVLRRDGQEVRTCEPRSAVGKFDIVLAHDDREVRNVLAVEIGPEGSFGKLETTWTGAPPRELTALGFTEVSFGWRADCTYPLFPNGKKAGRVCPEVTLGGSTCTAVPTTDDAEADVCRYTCSTSATLELPATVELSNRAERWEEQLGFPGQILRDAPEQRRVWLDFGEWSDMRLRERSRIDGVLVEVDGDERYIDLRYHVARSSSIGRHAVAVPGSTCAVRYEVLGEDPSGTRTAIVEHGRAAIKRPPSKQMMLVPVGSLSIGHLARLGDDGLPATGLGDGVDVRLDLAVRFQRRSKLLFFEAGYFASAGTREYVRVDGSTRDLRGWSHARLGYAIAIGIAFPGHRYAFPRTALSIGGSGGGGFVFLPGEGAGIRGGGLLSPHARVDIGPLALALRFHFFERLHELAALTGERIGKHRAIYSKLELQYRFELRRLEGWRRARRLGRAS